jgi:hypothetical protein
METMSLNDKQGVEICDSVGRTLVDELEWSVQVRLKK